MASTNHGLGTTDEVPHTRSYFYVGGRYDSDEKGVTTYRDQMYTERLLPVGGVTQKTPIVLIHGQAQTGTVSKPRATCTIVQPDLSNRTG